MYERYQDNESTVINTHSCLHLCLEFSCLYVFTRSCPYVFMSSLAPFFMPSCLHVFTYYSPHTFVTRLVTSVRILHSTSFNTYLFDLYLLMTMLNTCRYRCAGP
jgi:hypothetical protein